MARLLRGFSSSSNDGIRPKIPQAVRISKVKTKANGANATTHIHLIILGSTPFFLRCAITTEFGAKIIKNSQFRIHNSEFFVFRPKNRPDVADVPILPETRPNGISNLSYNGNSEF